MAIKDILVIDDDRDLTKSLKTYLEAHGLGVRTACGGTEGMELIGQKKPDLIVLDIMMDNDIDGFNLAYKLKNEEENSSIPIIILSGFTDHLQEKMEKFEFVLGRDWPAAEFIEKPAPLERIHKAVERLLA